MRAQAADDVDRKFEGNNDDAKQSLVEDCANSSQVLLSGDIDSSLDSTQKLDAAILTNSIPNTVPEEDNSENSLNPAFASDSVTSQTPSEWDERKFLQFATAKYDKNRVAGSSEDSVFTFIQNP